ncbi:MAG: hypothetical protein IJF07_00580 [Lachnospiraceae bacterium]|nr:hypothetical protein [Lachnospiraceae bacterium]
MTNTIKRQNFIWHALPLFALVVWGALCITNNLWYDEAYSASMVSQSWYRMIYITAVDAHSPFYYALLKLVYHLCGGGTNFISLKLLSLFFMMGYMLLGKYYVRKLFNQQISIYFMLFSLLMPIMSVQAGNVRMYALGLFCMTLTGLTAYDIYLDATKKKWVVFALASICTMYCHTFAMIQTFFLYLLFMGALIYSRQRSKLKPFFVCGITVSIAFLPWLFVTCRQMLLRMKYDTGSVSDKATIYSFMDYCKEWFSALETPIGPVIFVGMALLVVFGYLAVDWVRTQKNYAPILGVAALFLTALTGAIVSTYINNCFLGRYAFPGFGFLMLFYAVGMSQLSSHKIKCGILAAFLFCFLLQYQSELALEHDKGLATYEQFWEEQVTKKDVIIGPFAHTIFLSVYHPDMQYYLEGYKLYKLPFSNTDELLDYHQLSDVQGNIWYICFEGSTPDKCTELYDYEEAVNFHFMYYDFVIYKLIRK